MDEQTLAELAAWLEAYSLTTDQVKEATSAAAAAAWLAFAGWYSRPKVEALAREMAAQSAAAQQTTAGAASQYVAAVAAILGVSAPLPGVPFTTIRNGVDPILVNTRPAEAYKRAVATGSTHEEALEKAGLRASGLMLTDLTLQDRQAMNAVMESMGVTQFRRIIRPELSRTGSCGLCIAAATKIYDTGDLMPIHPPSCKCVVMPIIGDQDPGLVLNDRDLRAVLGQLYDDAGSTGRAALSNTKYQVNFHGEYGPVLTRAGDQFRGPGQVALENDQPRVLRLLAKAAPVLDQMESDGEPVEGALDYQRGFVARLRDLIAA